nr:RNA-directed DNA polymerase, eukaryota [Tanacetum cinerariifolium]
NRLVGVLGDIVNEVQSAFIADKQILDGPFILNEVLQWCKLKRKQSLIFKVDFEKAFDSVRWDFLDEVLKKFGFGDKWCSWIQSCLKSSRGSILINGSPTEEFKFFKGLKQGDPLSPFLFILIMESLHLSFQWVVDAGMFKGIKLNSSTSISHMFYADDAVFVGQWCDDNINTLIHVLKCFYRVFGLRINMSKNKIMGVLVAENKVKSDVTKLGCLLLNTPFTYLGTKVGGSIWDEVINKLDNSFRRMPRGEIEHAQFTELSDRVYDVILLPISDRWIWSLEGSGEFTVTSIRMEIDDKRLSGVTSKTRWIKSVPIKVNVHAWKVKLDALLTRLNISRRGIVIDSILCPICDNGVESSNHLFFTCNLARQLSRMITHLWDTPQVEGNSYDDWWSWLLSWRLSSKYKLILEGIFYVTWWYLWSYRNKLLFESKNPLKATIFDDIVSSLKVLYPRLYALENSKHVSVSMKLTDVKLDNSFRRMPRGEIEHAQFTELSDRVYDVILLPISDRWIWSLEGSGEFTVTSIRMEIDDKRLSGVTSKTRWIKSVPIKVNVHAWKVKLDALLTRLNISRR